MDETGVWLSQELAKLSKKQNSYENRAFLAAMKKVADEQNERTEKLQGEVDGRLWNHEQW
ncbi:hypothetical protein FD29_GL001550 [Companilactobacillus mindensis DSM 14500]|uniref:Uncharacterized protein n=1 Tax=Companilactobacillus mindensis DSM 14500 TaxID=1423770 RepID=A0A0R1QE21_9LACO|nr:hypothetical protein [Companilactobacillus mindensis]KRL42769.1 hypothetical protein FD29_GL001550 [Companilactobacillus mindensis DSM 14500]GEO79847.1 hypothetical protein LMI01_21780 [Companilactobacillus mindensis]